MTLPPIRVGTRALAARHAPSRAGRRADPQPRWAARSSWSRSRTEGDRSHRRQPLATVGGTGVFVSALRDALLRGDVDVAVHSLKDLPTYPADGIALAAVPPARTRATSSSPATG